MLNLSLTTISRAGQHARWEVPPDDPLWEGAEIALTEPVIVEVDAQPLGTGILVRGRIGTAVSLQCRRCVKDVEHGIDERFELLFEPLQSEEQEELAGEVYPLPTRGDLLELGEAIREHLLLHRPDHVVCDEACRGLCPHCGADLNEVECDCAPDPEQGPWDALKQLKFD
jgi:uncharacterized protein